MRVAMGTKRVAMADIGVAAVSLLGVLALGYGYFHPHRLGFYSGLFLTVGAVVFTVVRMITQPRPYRGR